MTSIKPATEATRRSIQASAAAMPFHDRQDFDDATRGFIGRTEERHVRAADGRVVWDLDAYEFLRGAEAPDTAHPSLWRQSQLLIEDGLFEQFPVEAVFGMHNWPGIAVGEMAVMPGPVQTVWPVRRQPPTPTEHASPKPLHCGIWMVRKHEPVRPAVLR